MDLNLLPACIYFPVLEYKILYFLGFKNIDNQIKSTNTSLYLTITRKKICFFKTSAYFS